MNPAFSILGTSDAPSNLLEYSRVGLAFMDYEHNAFAVLHTELQQLVNSNRPSIIAIDATLEQIIEHLSQHFDHEEKAMKSVDYPYLSQHRRQHQRALENIALQIGRWKNQRNIWSLRDFVNNTLVSWFEKHVGSSDTAAALFILHKQAAL